MISEQDYIKPVIIEKFSLRKSSTSVKILQFLKEYLPEFEIAYKESKLLIQKEDDISSRLCLFFNDKANTHNILFNFNAKEGVDFTIFVSPFQMISKSIFIIEAKRLSSNHYDYVSGRTGGIERFKKEQSGFGSHLKVGAMIGYIQDEDKEFWYKKINSWIDELINSSEDNFWNDDDRLLVESTYSDYVSEHIRYSQISISLFHYWINLN